MWIVSMYIFIGIFTVVASAICLVLLSLSKKHREESRAKSDLLLACIWSGVFALVFLIATEFFAFKEWFVLWSVLAMITTVFLILYTVSILCKKRIIVPLWSLGITGPTLLFYVGINMRLISDGVNAHASLISAIFPLFVIISIIVIFVILKVKRRQTKRD